MDAFREKKKMKTISELKTDAANIRKLTIDAIASAGYGHIGGSMSICDFLSVLYGDILVYDPLNPNKEDSDCFILSKGHCGPALYSTLAYHGFFPLSELSTLNQNGTSLPGHCDRLKTKGIYVTTGSLGQGLGLATGVALGKRLKNLPNKVYVMVGDGEMEEGQCFEALEFIHKEELNNLILIVDNNKKQLDGYIKDICPQTDIVKKIESFGFEVEKVEGDNVFEIRNALLKERKTKPFCLVLDTEKGHGCNFAEIHGFNHYMTVTKEMAENAKNEIDRRLKEELK